jgi:protein-disulfide isomerase
MNRFFSSWLSRRSLLQMTAIAVAGSTVAFSPVPLLAQSAMELDTPPAMGDKMLGKPDAPVTVIEYSSFTCPHCANFHTKVLPKLKEKYINTGKVKFLFREFPLGPLAAYATMVARCVAPDKYFSFVDVLFKHMEAWRPVSKEDPLGPLSKIALQVGMPRAEFDKCIKNEDLWAKISAEQKRASERFKINSTPTFFIDGKKLESSWEFDNFSKKIDGRLGK